MPRQVPSLDLSAAATLDHVPGLFADNLDKGAEGPDEAFQGQVRIKAADCLPPRSSPPSTNATR